MMKMKKKIWLVSIVLLLITALVLVDTYGLFETNAGFCNDRSTPGINNGGNTTTTIPYSETNAETLAEEGRIINRERRNI